MSKKNNTILSIVLASPLIIGIIVAGIFRFDLTKGEWITLVTSCVSTFAAIFLGFMVFFQNENHKKRSEEMAKEHEKQEQIFRDEEQKNRDQDLIIKANPVVYLNGISRFDLDKEVLTWPDDVKTPFSEEDYPTNCLYENKLNDCRAMSCFSFDIVFKNINGKMIDFITISSARLTCSHGSYIDQDYEEKFCKSFTNFNSKNSIVKIGNDGQIVTLLMLFINEEEYDALKQLFHDESLGWALTFEYCMSNSCNVEVKFESQILFKVEPNLHETQKGVFCKTKIKQIVTWQRSAVTISKEKTNELKP